MKTRGYGRVLTVTALIILSAATLIMLVLFSLYLYARANIDFDADEAMFETSLHWDSTTFYADEYKTDAEYTPIAIETSGSLKKTYYSLDQISDYVKDGFISVEDRIFYSHNGVDVKRTLYAMANLILKKQKKFGASTITQQVVKNISGDNEITLKRKLSEIIRATNIEQKYSKNEIFEVYLNVIPMGDNIFGVGHAAKAYFGKEPSDLTAAESATLIGITNAPTAYNPYLNPDACKTKRDSVLAVMLDTGIINQSEYGVAVSSPLGVIERQMREDKYDSWFTETVIADATRDFAEKYGISESAASIRLLGGGYSIYTTMDVKAQRILENYFENTANFPDDVARGLEFAMVVTDAQSGDLAAIVGRVGKKRSNRILNHATVPHTPASAIKPLSLYAPLIDEGAIRWSSVFDDVPTDFLMTNGELTPYPRNSPAVYDGLITLADAIRVSKNTVAARIYNLRGGKRIFGDLKDRYGITTLVASKKTDNGTITDIALAPLALGQMCDGISLRKMTECYGAFVADGLLTAARSYILIKDSSGKTVISNEKEQKRIYKPSTARIMNQLLSCVVKDGTAKSITLKNMIDMAGKTGTASGAYERMFIGYTPYYVGGIWCGYEGERRAVTSSAHLTAWDSVMHELHKEILSDVSVKSFSTEGLVYRPYCMDSGELYSDNCTLDPRGSRIAYGYFSPDNAPTALCKRHVLCPYDTLEKGVALGACPREDVTLVALLDIPDRSFPVEVYVTDAEFVYRGIKNAAERDATANLPYFYCELSEGEYAGISNRKRQFNAPCPRH